MFEITENTRIIKKKSKLRYYFSGTFDIEQFCSRTVGPLFTALTLTETYKLLVKICLQMGIVYLKFILLNAIFKARNKMSKRKDYENYSNEAKGGQFRKDTSIKSQFVEMKTGALLLKARSSLHVF